MKTGTCYFPSYGAALRYYRPYLQDNPKETRDDSVRRYVNDKLNASEIRIGKPDLKPGESLSIEDNRYHINQTEK